MKKKVLMVLAAALVCAAGIAAVQGQRGDPEAVAALLSQRLENLDMQPEVLERQEPAVLQGERYTLNFSGGALELYAYRDPDAAARDLLRVSEDGRQIGAQYVVWSQPPHYFLRDNVIVLYLGEDAEILDMLQRLCGPQIRGAVPQL